MVWLCWVLGVRCGEYCVGFVVGMVVVECSVVECLIVLLCYS